MIIYIHTCIASDEIITPALGDVITKKNLDVGWFGLVLVGSHH